MSGPQRVSFYICSTGTDMATEGRYLRAVILPELQARVADLNVEIVCVDLFEEDGWVQATDAEWLQRALAEIDRCRPFFIALVGERYGLPLAGLPDAVVATYPRLAGLTGRSRFALEITHALAGSLENACQLHFYQRRPSVLAGVPASARKSFAAESEEAAAQLIALRAEIRAAGGEIREYNCGWDEVSDGISDFDQLRALILDDIEASVRRERKPAEDPDHTGFRVPLPPMSPRGSLSLPKSDPDVTRAGGMSPPTVEPISPPDVADAAAPSTAPKVYDENVQFTVYRPQVVQPQRWYTLLAFAHLSERRADADASEPDPVQEVERQARQMLGDELAGYRDVSEDSAQAVPREGELTFVPRAEGIEFNPKSRSFLWEESVHREDFRLRAQPGMAGHTARGALTVYLGSILLAEVTLSIRVDASGNVRHLPLKQEHAAPYRKLFPSYSHKDETIVAQLQRYALAVGDEYLRDATTLRSGEVWNDQLREMIRNADVFQLFWSWNSIKSPYVQQEWEYALSLARPAFIRPTYWEVPLPSMPDRGLPPEGLRRLHFHRLVSSERPETRVDVEMPVASPPQAPSPPPPPRRSAPPAPTARQAEADLETEVEQEATVLAPPPAPASRRPSRTFSMAASVLLLVGVAGLFLRESTLRQASSPVPPSTPPLVAAPATPAPPPAMRRFVLRGVNFDFGKAEIRPDAVTILSDSIRLLLEKPQLSLTIEGHADGEEESEARATVLAERRAKAVGEYLVAHGIPAARIHVAAFAASRPVASNDTDEGRAQNRRIELKVD